MAQFPDLKVVNYQDVRADIRSGDILIASGEYMFSKLIQGATRSCWSHVAFVMRLDEIDRVMVLESIEGKGVRTIPLSQYVSDFEGTGRGYKGRLAIARHRQFATMATAAKIQAMARFAVDVFSYPYDEEEIARITMRIVGSAIGFEQAALQRNREYICSEYVYECYRFLDIKVTYDVRGFVAPADFARDANIDLLWELQVKGQSQ